MSTLAATIETTVSARRATGASWPQRLARLTLGDFQERTRSIAFLLTLVAAVWSAHVFLPANGSNYATLSIGDHRGLYNSEWVGALVAMMGNVFLGFAGFYLVKSAIERDRRTKVGEVLAGTSISKPLYTLSKWLSNFLVLAGMIAVLGFSAAALQLLRGEDMVLKPLALISPLLWVTLPYMAMVAACAVFFEAVPFLRGGFGNVVWFAIWVAMLGSDTLGMEMGRRTIDVMGMQSLMPGMVDSGIAAFPKESITHHSVSMGFSFSDHRSPMIVTYVWHGVEWTAAMIGARLLWVAVAVGLALAAALPFDRFEHGSASSMGARPGGRARGAAATTPANGATLAVAAVPVRRGDPDALLAALATQRVRRGPALATLVIAELKVALKGMPRLWNLATLALIPLGLFVPLGGARVGVAAVAWVWPLMVWSALGTREARFGTTPLFASAPRPLDRQLIAQWLGSAIMTLALTAPLSLRLLAAGEASAGVTGLAGALVVPALALAAGTLTGSARLFEACYLCLWYGGVLNRVSGIDVSGASVKPNDWSTALVFLVATPIALVVARAGRARRLFS